MTSDYARQALTHLPPLQPPRRDMQSTVFKQPSSRTVIQACACMSNIQYTARTPNLLAQKYVYLLAKMFLPILSDYIAHQLKKMSPGKASSMTRHAKQMKSCYLKYQHHLIVLRYCTATDLNFIITIYLTINFCFIINFYLKIKLYLKINLHLIINFYLISNLYLKISLYLINSYITINFYLKLIYVKNCFEFKL